jgi:hypothetical protein
LFPLGPDDIFEGAYVPSKHVLKKKDERIQGLILRSGGTITFHGQMGEEANYLLLPHLRGMSLAMEAYESLYPSQIGLLVV